MSESVRLTKEQQEVFQETVQKLIGAVGHQLLPVLYLRVAGQVIGRTSCCELHAWQNLTTAEQELRNSFSQGLLERGFK